MAVTLRALLFISQDTNEVLLSRRWSGAEQARTASVKNAIIPKDMQFAAEFMAHAIKGNATSGVCNVGAVRGVSFVRRRGVYLLAVPVFESVHAARADAGDGDGDGGGAAADSRVVCHDTAYLDLGLSATFVLLEELALLLPENVTSLSPESPVMVEILIKVGVALPFGKPIETNGRVLKGLIQESFPAVDAREDKQHAWKPFLFSGRSKVEFTLSERIVASLVEGRVTHACIYGTIVCKADVAGQPDVTVVLGNTEKVSHITVHECVTPPDTFLPTRLFFSPPLDAFDLCQYSVTQLETAPISGRLRIEPDNDTLPARLKLMVSLVCDDASLRASLNPLIVRISLPPRCGAIVRPRLTATSGGTIAVDGTGLALTWNVPAKLGGKTSRVTVEGTVTVEGDVPTRLDCTAIVSWSCSTTVSGFGVHQDGLVTYPTSNPSVTVKALSTSNEYLIHNDAAPPTYPQPLQASQVRAALSPDNGAGDGHGGE